MYQKPKTYFFSRFAAFIIDFALIYGTAFILYNVLQQFHLYLSTARITLGIALIYYPFVSYTFKASMGKILLGLTIENKSKRSLGRSILFRELVYKQLLLILPVSMALHLTKLWWLSPYFEILCVLFLGVFLFVGFLFTKRTWYDQLAKTAVVADPKSNRKLKTRAILLLAGVSLLVFGIRGYFFLRTESFSVPFVPKHSKGVISPYVSFLKEQKDAKDYIFELFEKNDVVVLCERMHPELSQYDFITDLISDNRFIENVGNVFSEVGSITQQAKLDQLMHSDSLSTSEFEQKLAGILQNISFFPLWEFTNQFDYYSHLYRLNQGLPVNKRIQHYVSDIPCNWDSIRNKQDYSRIKDRIYQREKILAANVIDRFDKIKNSGDSRKKCLVIMNYRHAFGLVGGKEQKGDSWQTCTSYIMKKYPGKVANVMLNTVKNSFGLCVPDYPPYILPVQNSPIKKGIWDNAFAQVENKSLGFNFADSPFGNCKFDLFFIPVWKKYRYQDVFTGFVFYKPLEEHSLGYGFKNINTNDFFNEVSDRAKRIDDDALDNNLAYWTHKVNLLRKQEITLDEKPYQQHESVFELIWGTILLILGLLLSFRGFLKRKK